MHTYAQMNRRTDAQVEWSQSFNQACIMPARQGKTTTATPPSHKAPSMALPSLTC